MPRGNHVLAAPQRQCGGQLERFDGDAYCPLCVRYTVTIHREDDPTMADVSELESAVGFRPRTTVRDGIAQFVEWYRAYYKIAETKTV